MPDIPKLPAHCGSWIIVRKGTNEAVAEFFERSTVARINSEKYEALAASDYLARVNREISGRG